MNETYNQLKDLAQLYRGTEDMNQLALNYQDTEDAILLSYAYCKNIGLTMTQADKYFGLTDDDLSSFALEEMHKALMHFKTDGGAKLVTLYSRFYNNRLRTETQSLSYDKRKSNTMADSLDGTKTDSEENVTTSLQGTLGYEESSFDEIELLMSLAGKEGLSENEYKYCEIIVKDVTDVTQIRDSDIAKTLNISSAAVHYIKKSLQKKIAVRTNSNFVLNL